MDVVKEATLWNFQSEPVDPDGLNTVRSTLDFLVKSGKAPNAFRRHDLGCLVSVEAPSYLQR